MTSSAASMRRTADDRAAAMVAAGDFSQEEARAFLEPMEDVMLRVKEWPALVGEGEDTWRGFLESHPELEN